MKIQYATLFPSSVNSFNFSCMLFLTKEAVHRVQLFGGALNQNGGGFWYRNTYCKRGTLVQVPSNGTRHNLPSTNELLLSTPICRSYRTLGDCSFIMADPRLWKPLPTNIKNARTVDSFKALLKTHLFKSVFSNQFMMLFLFNILISVIFLKFYVINFFIVMAFDHWNMENALYKFIN